MERRRDRVIERCRDRVIERCRDKETEGQRTGETDLETKKPLHYVLKVLINLVQI